ncbi:MAG: hypothetical protein JSS76_17620 [Bacteroidetes bacterium]|nr:hypothetical protein [Bacteroidota bacterium]MBS1686561.1 hypothetical protein [Bacteroidota bacterium]
MILAYREGALEALREVADFLDTINTEGSGEFWVINFLKNLEGYVKPNVQYAVCRHPEFAQKGLSCISLNGWIIAFKIEEEIFLVYSIVRGNLLS